MTESILVGVDGQGSSRRALEWAVGRAARSGGSVHAVCVLARTGQTGEELGAAELAVTETLQRDVDAMRAIAPEVEIRSAVEHGEVVDVLERLSGDHDLVVIGTNFRPGVLGRMRGTRTLKIVATSTVPVVVVPDVDLTGRQDVVVGVDGSREAEKALEFAAVEADRSGEELVVLQACPLPVGSVPAYADLTVVQESVAQRAREEVSEITEQVRGAYPELRVGGRVTMSRPAEALSDAGESAALVVVGSRGLGAVRRWLLGSVSSEVLLNMTGPVAIVR